MSINSHTTDSQRRSTRLVRSENASQVPPHNQEQFAQLRNDNSQESHNAHTPSTPNESDQGVQESKSHALPTPTEIPPAPPHIPLSRAEIRARDILSYAQQVNTANTNIHLNSATDSRGLLLKCAQCPGSSISYGGDHGSNASNNGWTNLKKHINNKHLNGISTRQAPNIGPQSELYHQLSKTCIGARVRYCFTHCKFTTRGNNASTCLDNNCYMTGCNDTALSVYPMLVLPVPIPIITPAAVPGAVELRASFTISIDVVLEAIITKNIPTLSAVPVQCQPLVSSTLTKLLNRALDSPSALTLLLMFAKACLYSIPEENGKFLKSHQLAERITTDIAEFFRGGADTAYNRFLEVVSKLVPRPTSSSIDDVRNHDPNRPSESSVKRSLHSAYSNDYSKALRQLTASPRAPSGSPLVSPILTSLHPASYVNNPDIIQRIDRVEQIASEASHLHPQEILDKDIFEALRDARPSDCAGTDGLHRSVLKDLLVRERNMDTTGLSDALRKFFTKILNSSSQSTEMIRCLNSAHLIALVKNPEETLLDINNMSLRPIVINSSYTRLLDSITLAKARQRIVPSLAPSQLGQGISSGVQKAILVAQCEFLRSKFVRGHGKVRLAIDITNAFNSICRASIVNQWARTAPEFLTYILKSHSIEETPLYCSDGITISSQEGTRQGSAIGSLSFVLGIDPLLHELHNQFPNLSSMVWICDDGNIFGEIDEVSRVYIWLKTNLPKYGLQVNPTKCKIGWVLADNTSIDDLSYYNDEYCPRLRVSFPDLAGNIFSPDGDVILGTFVGNTKGVTNHFRSVIDDSRSLYDHMKHLNNPQIQQRIQRLCFHQARVNHLLATTPNIPIDLLDQYDRLSRDFFNTTSRISCSDIQWKQVTKPLRLGGFGIANCKDLRLTALYASLVTNLPSVANLLQVPHNEISTLFEPLFDQDFFLRSFPPATRPQNLDSAITTLIQELLPNTKTIKLQRLITHYVQDQLHAASIPSLDLSSKINLIGNCNRNSYRVFVSPFGKFRNTILTPTLYRILVWRRLRFPMFQEGARCRQCSAHMDIYGDHALLCHRGQSSHQWRHKQLLRQVAEVASHSRLSYITENHGLVQGYSADISITNFDEGKRCIADITIGSPFSSSNLVLFRQVPFNPLAGVQAAGIAKFNSVQGLAFAALPETSFVPLAFDCFAQVPDYTMNFLNLLVLHNHRATGYDYATTKAYVFDKIFCRLQSLCATMILDRFTLPLDQD